MLIDRHERDEFAKNLAQNFSVIASPGTGKTTAIAERISNLIHSGMPIKNFAAVTYTNKAAKEIKERVYSKILYKGATSGALFSRLDEMFFGTIHGLCAQFLREHHGKVGLSEDFEITDDDRELWLEFSACINSIIDKVVPPELRRYLTSHFKLGNILAKARKIITPVIGKAKFNPIPAENMVELLNFKSIPAGKEEFQSFQEDIRIWLRLRGTCPFPTVPPIRGKNKQFQEKIREYLRWKSDAESYFSNKISEEYVAFKIFHNVLSYGDLMALALKILIDGEYVKKHVQNYSIILDEAQDTDEIQFKILLNLVSPNLYEKIFDESECGAAQTGAFSMVGDPKQAIYSDRANVKFYLSVHDKLAEKHFLKHLSFSVTMRCSNKIVEFVNNSFGNVFAGSNVNFIPMHAKREAKQGCVEILNGESMETLIKIFSNKTCNDLGVKNFSEVCILAPRKSWLSEISKSFVGDRALPKMQLGFSESLENTPSLPKWVASALHFMNNICDHREFAGILREIFGISTREIMRFFNRGSSALCELVHADFLALKHEQFRMHLSNFVRKIMDKFHLIPRIRLLNIFSEDEINTHYESIMDITYRTDLSCDDLESKIIELYKNPQIIPIPNEDSVQLFSFHKSKGLEWSVVILPFMHRERKLMGQKLTTDAFDNERRMLFVAFTRAKEKLIMIDDSAHYTSLRRINIISSASLIAN
ncbi:MAG: UvrD-helicase domain-containing protein [Puniceicoccales bacterium]|jgi:superfamily I DNA/RNA helicase|nr:UvrD-helicase domain-containing protein [Puniceicoccales bacterium]